MKYQLRVVQYTVQITVVISIATARIIKLIKLIKLFGLRAKVGLQAGPSAALFLFLFFW